MYYTYMLRCDDNSIYTGITTCLERRMEEHFSRGARSAGYTRSHFFKAIEAAFESESRQTASRLEYLIKRLPKKKKEELIKKPQLLCEFFGSGSEKYRSADISGIAEKCAAVLDESKYFVYESPLGRMYGEVKGEALCGLWFESQLKTEAERLLLSGSDSAPAAETCRWLDIYFSGREPDFTPPIHLTGSDYRISVWKLLLQIPYGKTVTYGEIASEIAASRGLSKKSAQAVGGAVGHNPISVIIPCHRVIGSDGRLVGYAGGIDLKEKLLKTEGHIILSGSVCRNSH